MTLVGPGIASFKHGIALDETGINAQAFSRQYKPEFIDLLHGINGEVRGQARGAVMTTLTVSGQVAGSTGVMAFTFYTACTLANVIDGFGQTAGLVLLDDATVSSTFDGWQGVNQTLSRYAGITSIT